MTIDESLTSTPQGGGPVPQEDLATLVRTLADQAKAADQRAATLAEQAKGFASRLALLEGRPNGRSRSTGASFRSMLSNDREIDPGSGSSRNTSTRSTNAGISDNGDDGNNGSSGRPEPKNDETANPAPQDNNSRRRVSRVTFASTRNASPVSFQNAGLHNNSGSLNTVVAVPEDDPEEALADRVLFLETQLENNDNAKSPLDERKYELPESTFSLLITCHPASVPFGFAVVTIALAIVCLSLTLASSVTDGMKGYGSGVPAGVGPTVRAAQFIGAIVGVLMEDEIPQGLQLIANGAGHSLLLNGEKPVQKRVVVSSVFRLLVGYLFLASLFIAIAQSSDVIEIFYDVLALEFVEHIDDTTFALAKRGFFGRSLLIAANERHDLEISGTRGMRPSIMMGNTASATERRLSFSGFIASNNRVNHLVRAVYFLNATILLVGLGIITYNQNSGHYRCNRVNVLFDEEIWEHAYVKLPGGSHEQRLLIYSYFNGIYQEDGSHDGYPRYVEQNKDDGSPFGPSSVRGAEIIYCDEISSWVFMHPDILTTPIGQEENECSWLWKSTSTDDYDLLSTMNGDWEAWIGEVKQLADMSIKCMECSERSDCNYHGECVNSECDCDEEYTGDSCEFEMPCVSLATEKAQMFAEGMHWEQDNPIKDADHSHLVYNRPLYLQEGLSGQPYDMRLYKIREKVTALPSGQPSSLPSVSNGPSDLPSQSPSYSLATAQPTFVGPMTVGINFTEPADDPPPRGGAPDTITPTQLPTKMLHNQQEYDIAPDFADWDDFFESPSLHDGLEEVLKDYKVVISFTGSRFYGTITESNATLEEIFPPDYHAFWDQAFDVDRTFIISDPTSSSSPVGVDFFEMRRRINTLLNPNVRFEYGPFGALIPLMEYQGTGFFHCLDEPSQPSTSPSSSSAPSISASPSQVPSWSPSPRPSSSPSPSTAPTVSSAPTISALLSQIRSTEDD